MKADGRRAAMGRGASAFTFFERVGENSVLNNLQMCTYGT